MMYAKDMNTNTADRKTALFAKIPTATLLDVARALENKTDKTADERMSSAWTVDEIERRVGIITLDEELEFERVYDSTNSYLTALVALRPQLANL